MIARIEFPYGAREKFIKLSEDEESYTELRQIFGGAAPSPENRDKEYYWPTEIIIDIETDGVWLANHGIQYTVLNFKGTMPLKAILPEGQTVHVHIQIPHVGLLAIDEVTVEEDCCTDRLQNFLDNGWRILCVCPPNATRRPDYILGRTKERK